MYNVIIYYKTRPIVVHDLWFLYFTAKKGVRMSKN